MTARGVLGLAGTELRLHNMSVDGCLQQHAGRKYTMVHRGVGRPGGMECLGEHGSRGDDKGRRRAPLLEEIPHDESTEIEVRVDVAEKGDVDAHSGRRGAAVAAAGCLVYSVPLRSISGTLHTRCPLLSRAALRQNVSVGRRVWHGQVRLVVAVCRL